MSLPADRADLHPRWRLLHLLHLRQLRRYLRERGRGPRMLKEAQREAARARARYNATRQGPT